MTRRLYFFYQVLWLVIGPNLIWQMCYSGQVLIHPFNMAIVALAVVGTIAVFFRRAGIRFIAALCGIFLAGTLLYQCWPFMICSLGDGEHLNSTFWFFEFHDVYAQIDLWAELVLLIVSSGCVAYFMADEMDKKQRPNQALLPTPMSVTDRADARSAPDTGAADL